MKKFYVLLAILFIGKFTFAQVFQETFQTGTIPSTFTLINDGNTVNSAIATLFPTAWSCLPQPNDTANKVAASPSWFSAVVAADRWMITPAIVLPAGSNLALTFKSKAQDPAYKDGLKVKISTTGINKTDFTISAYDKAAEDSNFTTKSYSLQSLAGQTIRVAFIQQSTDMFYIIVDDIKVATSTGITEEATEAGNISIYPNPVNDVVNVNSNSTIQTIKIYNAIGQVVLEKQIKEKSASISVDEFKAGIYFITAETEKGSFTKKINIQ